MVFSKIISDNCLIFQTDLFLFFYFSFIIWRSVPFLDIKLLTGKSPYLLFNILLFVLAKTCDVAISFLSYANAITIESKLGLYVLYRAANGHEKLKICVWFDDFLSIFNIFNIDMTFKVFIFFPDSKIVLYYLLCVWCIRKNPSRFNIVFEWSQQYLWLQWKKIPLVE